MKNVEFRSIEELTEENMKLFEDGLREIEEKYKDKEDLLDSQKPPHFDSIEQYMEYYDVEPFEEFDRRFRSEEQ